VVDITSGKIIETMVAGHTAMSPVLSPDGKTLYVCNRFNNNIGVIDIAAKRLTKTIAVSREPYAASITPDSGFLFVANHLHNGSMNADNVAAQVSVVELASGKVTTLELPNGSGVMCDIRVSPDGKYACLTHILARFHLPTTQLERGWMNTDAITLIDVAKRKVINTILVDNVDRGAANPYGVAWSDDSQKIFVTHAGTHELSIIELTPLLAKLAKLPETLTPGQTPDYISASRISSDVPNDLAFLVGIRQRIKLNGLGPRPVIALGDKVYTGNYFSDNLNVVDLKAPVLKPVALSLGSVKPMNQVRRGEFLFNDASICFQTWQSCASCHSFDARVDALNWDLLNDGIGNPKNNRSLLYTHRFAPSMAMGVRPTAESAVRAGIRHILFTVQPEEVPVAMDEYLKTLEPVPSPYLVDGKLSASAVRGEKLFKDEKVGCIKCHQGTYHTDMRRYDVGTLGAYDKQGDLFFTPTLVEIWRTAPYLHDGSTATIMDVLNQNKHDKHGKTSHLSPNEIEDLVAYIHSL